MGFSTILLLITIILIGIYAFLFVGLNKAVVHLDLLFFELDFQLGYLILWSILAGIIITLILEIIYFSAKRKNNDE